MISREDKEFVAKTLTFWEFLNDIEKMKIVENIFYIRYSRGDIIYRGDGECAGILIIKTGCLRVYMLSEDGREVTLYRLNQGDVCVLSSSCVISNITFDVQISVEASSEVLVINSNIYNSLFKNNIYVENFSHREAVSRFSDVMWTMQQILFMSVDKRLANFIIDEISKDKSSEINMTHEQIANYIGSAREVVSRMLKYFASEGWVELSRGVIKVINRNELSKLL